MLIGKLDPIRLRRRIIAFACLAVTPLALQPPPLAAQTPTDMQAILERLDRLEAQNRSLLAEVRTLKAQLSAAQPTAAAQPAPQAVPTEERLAVQEARTSELSQSKVEASQRFPLRLAGMVLFNAYMNANTATGFPVAVAGDPTAGASFRQTILGFDYSGPTTIWNGKVSGALRMDFYGGSGRSLDQDLRIRTAKIAVDWKSRSVMAGVEKSLIAPRDPESIAQVGVSPLTGSGNLWSWLPQIRFTQEFKPRADFSVRAQMAVVQTHEAAGVYDLPKGVTAPSTTAEPGRPAFQARVEFAGGSDRRVEIAPGYHHSVSHVGGASAASNIANIDWLVRPVRPIEFSGDFFRGENVAPLGGLSQGVVLTGAGRAASVHSTGGWAQLKLHASQRLWLNAFTGQQDDRNSQLPTGAIAKSFSYGGNVFFRLTPNVLASFEAYQTRLTYIQASRRLRDYYDFALAYLF